MIRKVAQPIGCMIYIYIYYLHFVDLWEMQQVHVKGCFCQGFQSIIQGDHLTSNDSILTSPRVTKGRRPVGYGADLYRFVLQFTCIYIYIFLFMFIHIRNGFIENHVFVAKHIRQVFRIIVWKKLRGFDKPFVNFQPSVSAICHYITK